MWQKIKSKLKGWKTIIFHGFVASSGAIVLTVDQLKLVDWTQFFTPTRAIIAGIAVSLVGIWLRFVTDTAVGQGSQKAE